MEVNETVVQEIKHIMETGRSAFDYSDLMKQVINNVKGYLHIAKVRFTREHPVTNLRPNGIHDVVEVMDNGKSDQNSDVLINKNYAKDGGFGLVEVFSESGYKWSDTQKDELNFLFYMMYIHFSQTTLTMLLDKNIKTDMMTGIANQAGFFDCVYKYMSVKNLKETYTLFFNIRDFKYVNRIFSYKDGDIILSKYVKEVEKLIHKDELEVIARMGGDNFVALVHKEHIDEFIEKLDHIVVEHEADGKHKTFIFSCIKGVASLEDIDDYHACLGKCGIAYQAARRTGQNTVFFSEKLHQDTIRSQEALMHFDEAIKNHEFVVYYQPKVDAESLEMCGAEALVRWIREGKLISPMHFVPIFERSDRICQLDYYVLENVCKNLAQWKKEGRDLVKISVNFSRKHLDEDNFVERVISIINKYEIEPNYIEAELTESDNFHDYQIMSKVVGEFKNYGLSTSIDDFGTGYSSLNMLKDTEFDIVKIDRSFIPSSNDYQDESKENAMFKSIMDLIEQLGMTSIAEGVETKEQLNFIMNAKCHMVQGYIFDKPLPCEEFVLRLDNPKYKL